jgi:hypothetical protein
VVLPEQRQYKFTDKTWISKTLSLEAEKYHMSHGECALRTFSSSNGLIPSIQNVLSRKSLYYSVRNGG